MGSEEKKKAIAQAAAQLDLIPAENVSEEEAQTYTKIPWTRVAAMGTAFASMAGAFRTVTVENVINGAGLFRPVSMGAPGQLVQAADGSGLLGLIMNQGKISGHARWQEVGNVVSSTTVTMPVDPTTLAMMVMLAQIDKKLDSIMATQQEMFEYMKTRDRSQLKGGLNVMVDIMKGFKNNWDNESYRANEISRLKGIQLSAEQYLVHYRDLIDGKLNKDKPFLHFSRDAENDSKELQELLGDYQLALNSYTFSTFLLVLLEENYEANHLETVLASLEKRSNDYRTEYTRCFNRIEEMANTSVDQGVLGGLAFASKALGSVVEKTPLGDVSYIDEFLLETAENIDGFGNDQKASITGKVLSKRDGGALPFVESIREIKKIYNTPIDFLVGEDGVYFKQLSD